MKANKEIKATISQEKRIEEAESLLGKEVYLNGTKYTTKIMGTIETVRVTYPKKVGEQPKILFTVLWDGQKQAFYTNRSGFKI